MIYKLTYIANINATPEAPCHASLEGAVYTA